MDKLRDDSDGPFEFIKPCVLKKHVCIQCRRESYKGKEFTGWNDYADAWWTPCLTITPFSIGQLFIREGHVHCPPKVYQDMRKEVISLLKKNFHGDKKALLVSNLESGYPSSQSRLVTLPPLDWCPYRNEHEKKGDKLIKIFGAVIIIKPNVTIRFALKCVSCGNEFYIKEKFSKQKKNSTGLFVTTSISTKRYVICNKCRQKESVAVLKHCFFYGEKI